VKKRITRIAAALTIGTLATLGLSTITDLVAIPEDSGWGAPNLNTTVATETGTSAGLNATVNVTLGDSGWG